MPIGEYFQTADWKKEKHAPVIEFPDMVNIGEEFVVSLTIGKEIPHPNTTEHHINWIELYFKPENGKFPVMVGRYDFLGHGASAKGVNEGSLYTEPKVQTTIKIKNAGTLIATSYCNIHGLWESSKEIKVV
jgi:superoxide reductase